LRGLISVAAFSGVVEPKGSEASSVKTPGLSPAMRS
jgi:hypothetical protein